MEISTGAGARRPEPLSSRDDGLVLAAAGRSTEPQICPQQRDLQHGCQCCTLEGRCCQTRPGPQEHYTPPPTCICPSPLRRGVFLVHILTPLGSPPLQSFTFLYFTSYFPQLLHQRCSPCSLCFCCSDPRTPEGAHPLQSPPSAAGSQPYRVLPPHGQPAQPVR